MISRALLVALCIVCATSLNPLSASVDDDCALYLTGPGRSSAYDYSLNLLKGNFAYDGQHTCITYDAINQAYLDARTRILVSQPKGDWKAEDFASVGELILDISTSLARTYGLTYEEIEKGLPLIDTSRTLIREVCPPVFSHVECRAGKYRRLDGLCNNLRHPTWGATMAPFQRLIGPLFADGINAPRISHTGRDLPLSRVVSRTMHPDDGFHDHAGTVMVIAWGQFMDHDYTLTGTPLDPINRNDPEECCKRPPHLKHPYCNEIRVPDDDYFYRLFGVKCIDFVRGFPSPRPGCRLGSRVPFNTLTGAIDGNTVYGVTEKFARKLRTGFGGLLRMNPVFKEYGLRDLLPLKLDIPDEGCTRPNKNMYCFEAGEIRVNEQLVLTVMHTLMAREHNRVANGLAAVNPHWDDETLFQEARRINIAEIQHITYNEFLPILLGKDVMEKFGLVLEKEGYWDGYDHEVNPDVIDSFAAAAYRFGHSLLPTAVERWSKAHKFIASKRLSDLIRRPYDLYRAGVLDEYVMGLMNQVAQAMDDSITQEVTNHLFKKVGARFGMDLVSFNMQRGREFGLPGYMEFRKFCGLSGADSFQDLFGSMANETIQKYESIFEHPVDVDLWSGGVSERPLPGSMLGPTFACVIATQFSYSRRGDRFWFELPNQPSSFTPEQLKEVRKARLARVICDNTDIIDTVQLYPMVLPDHELNPRVPCRSGIIPSMDFSKWAEPTPFLASKNYMTDAFICNKTLNATESHLNLKSSENITNNVTLNDDYNSTSINNLPMHKKDNNDTLLKYVYKKNDIKNYSEKTKGHFKNVLKRKKRSEVTNVETEAKDGNKPKTLFNFKFNHEKDREELALPELTPDGIIKSANLADFNIETLHDHINPTKEDLSVEQEGISKTTRKEQQSIKHKLNSNESNESDENEEHRKTIINDKDSPKYGEGESRLLSDKNSSEEDLDPISKNISNTNLEDERSTPFSIKNSRPIYHELEINENDESKKHVSVKPINENNNSVEDSRESDQYVTYKPANDTLNNQKVIQEVDLDDFSYEHIDQNRKAKNESANYSQEIVHSNLDPKVNLHKKENENILSDNDEQHNSSEEYKQNDDSNENRTEIGINDGEIKPVIELNNEDSVEVSEENNNELRKPNLKESGITHKPSNSKTEDRTDVKQEFERIPLDYKHTTTTKSNATGTLEDDNDNNDSSEGTLDSISPINSKFDDNLNIKFSDITIKLPEIKLPEDILSYARDESESDQEKDGDNNESINDKEVNNEPIESNEESDDESEESFGNLKKKENKNDVDDFYSPYFYFPNEKLRKQNSQNKYDSEEAHEDLYEKFVRERFGKTKSSKKKSDKLQNYESRPNDQNLYKTVQNILQKADNIEKEAIKSGDPKAGYMWTLEYGENL